jgi:hypothetical protein
MPRERERERGNPKRGPTWYCRAARKICLHNLERVLSISRTPLTTGTYTPPMAFMEEEFLEEPIQVPPESLLYIVLDSHDSPSTIILSTHTTNTMDGTT